MKVIYRKDLNVEDIRTEEYWNRFRVFSIINKENFDYKLTTNSLIKSCLNSSDTILSELKSFKPDINETRDQEYENINLRTYIVEYLPLYTYIKLSNRHFNSLFKLRDFKYIDRDTTFFVRIPKQLTTNMEIRKTYEKIQFKSIANYREIYSSEEKNCKEYANYLLPLGVQNRAVLSLNLEDNIDLINSLLCSDLVVENQLGDMFEKVLSKEIKITPNSNRREVVIELLQYLEDLVSDKQRKDEDFYNFRFQYITDIVEHLITNFERLINPLGSKGELEFDYNDQVHIGKLIKRTSLRNIATSKGSMMTGYLSLMHIFQLQSYNYQMYIPFLSDFIDIDKELDRPANKSFLLPTKLDNNTDLKRDIYKRLTNQYRDIKKWREQSKKYMSEEVSKEFTKYLLPMSHLTRFNLYLDIDDIFDLRKKDFEYVDNWMRLFYQRDPIFKK
jgi:hypothetical protein